jgi:hypothetical protein
MIALCPTCHAAVTRGPLRITDDDLYAWKKDSPMRWASIAMPPATLHKLLVGSISVTGPQPFAVFDFDTGQSLSFHLDEGGSVLTLNAEIDARNGGRLLEMRRNTVSKLADGVEVVQRSGHVRATVDDWQSLLPIWAYRQLFGSYPKHVIQGVPLLDIKVEKPGVVRVSGIWSSSTAAVVITDGAICFHTVPDAVYPLSIAGAGEDTVLHVNGPGVLFGIQNKAMGSHL